MEYYFNELSIVDTSSINQQDIHLWAKKFAQTCVKAKKYGFKALRTSIYFSEIEIIQGHYKLGDWIKDRSSGDRDLKRRFKSLTTNMPLINSDDKTFPQFEFAIFKADEKEALGLGVAYLKQSIAISFPTIPLWEQLDIPLQYEYFDENESEETIISEVSVKNISSRENLEEHKGFIIERLTAMPVPIDWNPMENYLPNIKISNNILDIDTFYENNRQGSRGERMAIYRVVGSQIAAINHYEFNKDISDKNKTSKNLRDIYESKNTTGRTIYLSIDFEKGAFEVCDDAGVHIEEVLFNGISNGHQELHHSIKL